jgi:hypothetical protein
VKPGEPHRGANGLELAWTDLDVIGPHAAPDQAFLHRAGLTWMAKLPVHGLTVICRRIRQVPLTRGMRVDRFGAAAAAVV